MVVLVVPVVRKNRVGMKKNEKNDILEVDECGFNFYRIQPSGTRIAKADDFFTEKDELIIKKPFLTRSNLFDCFYPGRIRDQGQFERLLFWILLERVYVWE